MAEKRSASNASRDSQANLASSAAKKRRSSSSQRPNRKAKHLIKSLIQLESYDQEIADNVQGEDIWNEKSPLSADAQLVKPKSDHEPTSEQQTLVHDEEFAEREAKLDAELPEEYRKFRPHGYPFKIPPTDRPVRIYADGVFDLFHLGHMRQLEQAKKALPDVYLIVGVPSDKITHKYKGLTVLTDRQRYDTLRHCKWVDEVVEDAPWQVNQEFIDEHHIDYVAHDDIPYNSAGQDDVYQFVKEKGMFLTTQRTDGVSTSDIITKIIKDYDLYLMRNFARGVSRQELNVSWVKKNELDLKRHVNAFRESWKHSLESNAKDLYADLLAFAANAYNSSRRLEQFRSSFGNGDSSHHYTGDSSSEHNNSRPSTPSSVLKGVRDWVARRSAPASAQGSSSDASSSDNEGDHVPDGDIDEAEANATRSDRSNRLHSTSTSSSSVSASSSASGPSSLDSADTAVSTEDKDES